MNCDYANKLWQSVANLTGSANHANLLDPTFATGSYGEPSKEILTIHAEIISKLIKQARSPNLNADDQVRKIIDYLSKREKGTIKTKLENFIA